MSDREKETTTPAKPAKKPYVAPTLVHLGSLRELTAGSPGSSDEGGFPRPMTM